MNYTPNSVIEGQSVTLCCCSKSRPLTSEMWWDIGGRVLSRKEYTDVICHEITSTSRGDSGSYRCFAENEIGTVNDEVIITDLCKFKVSIFVKPILLNVSLKKQSLLNMLRIGIRKQKTVKPTLNF